MAGGVAEDPQGRLANIANTNVIILVEIKGQRLKFPRIVWKDLQLCLGDRVPDLLPDDLETFIYNKLRHKNFKMTVPACFQKKQRTETDDCLVFEWEG